MEELKMPDILGDWTRGSDDPVPKKRAKKVKAADSKRPKFPTRHIEVDDSTVISRVYYDRKTQTLDAVFPGSGKRYRYSDVPIEVFVDFVLSDSYGKFFGTNIRDKFGYRLVRVKAGS